MRCFINNYQLHTNINNKYYLSNGRADRTHTYFFKSHEIPHENIRHVEVFPIHDYERAGHCPLRLAGNYRVYTQGHLKCLGFIRRARELGFPLNQMRVLLHLRYRRADLASNLMLLPVKYEGKQPRNP